MSEVVSVGLVVLTVLLLAIGATAILLAVAYLVRRLRGTPSAGPEPRRGRHGRAPDPIVLVGGAVITVGLAVLAWAVLDR